MMNNGKKLSLEDKRAIADFYKSKPMTIEDVKKHFDVSAPTVAKILKSLNVAVWPKFKLYSPEFVEDYFERIDTEQKAYFLGLMITDGNIYTSYKSSTHPANINLTVQEQDKYILEKFKSELRVTKKVTDDGRGCCQLAVFSNKMAKDLERLYVTPNKSLSVRFPLNVPLQFYNALIRGILDGDGSVSYYSRQGRRVHTKAIRFCSGSYDFLNELVQFLADNNVAQQVSLYQEKDNLWSVAYRKNDDLEKLIDYIYDNSTVYLTRKKDKCDLIMKEIRRYRDN